ncbi:hypothetical protein QNH37_10130 [Peribacillus simplex]|nr:hypothetical protein [Peribacillus simplex]WHZ00231.1 hypothetical protein QNH37_10130 [Peribacillus simplex]
MRKAIEELVKVGTLTRIPLGVPLLHLISSIMNCYP